jgi:hypothetical protein
MLQTHLLEKYAPNSLALLYRPVDTGNPGHDMSEHISRFKTHRTDIEETQLIGGRVIGHIEHDLGPADEAELQHRILTISYAEKCLDSNPDAVEFVRVIKECAGDTDPRSLQVWASWAYDGIKKGLDAFNESANLSREEYKAQVISEVLFYLRRMAMELTAVTTTNEEQLLAEPEVYEYFGQEHCYTDGDDERERQTLFDLRCRELLDKQDTTDPFTAELRSITNKISRSHASSSRRSEAEVFESYLQDEGIKEEDLETLVEDFERVTEQYTEDGATSLHMSDGERFIVDGTLEEDIDQDYLPFQVKEIVPELRDLFTNGTKISSDKEDEYTISTFIEHQLDLIYGNRSDREARTVRTTRSIAYLPSELKSLIPEIEQLLSTTRNRNVVRKLIQEQLQARFGHSRHQVTPLKANQWQTPADKAGTKRLRRMINCARGDKKPSDPIDNARSTLYRMLPSIAKGTLTIDNAGLLEFEETTSVYSNAEVRRYVEEVLNQIIQNMARDFILNSLNRSPRFRGFFQALQAATDTRALIACIQAAYDARKTGKLSIKLFTALRTIYGVKRAELESIPLRRNGFEERQFAEETLNLIVQNMARNIARMNPQASPAFRSALRTLELTSDIELLTNAVRTAHESKLAGNLTTKMFAALNTIYETKRALLESQPFCREPQDDRLFTISTCLLNEASAIPTKQLRKLAIRIHTLPLQERERVRNSLREVRQGLYKRIKDGLAGIVNSASAKKLMYLRFAFYEDRKTGAPNEPHNMVHLLTQEDRAEVWELLKRKSRLPQPQNA